VWEAPAGLFGARASVQERVHGRAVEETKVRASHDCKFESQQLEERALGQGEPLLRETVAEGKRQRPKPLGALHATGAVEVCRRTTASWAVQAWQGRATGVLRRRHRDLGTPLPSALITAGVTTEVAEPHGVRRHRVRCPLGRHQAIADFARTSSTSTLPSDEPTLRTKDALLTEVLGTGTLSRTAARVRRAPSSPRPELARQQRSARTLIATVRSSETGISIGPRPTSRSTCPAAPPLARTQRAR
jgi:hypothetical protein